MSDKQIAFIICTNDELYYSECVRYLSELEVPEGHSTDIICIQGAESMTQGYNAGMQASEAKYKVYLHHDTFILNKYFIYDILKVFQSDATIGMLGMIGATSLSPDAKCYLDWNVGNVNAYSGSKVYINELYQREDIVYIPVWAIDGMLMVTQRDVPWREDVFDKWDFYDVSQSIEMLRAGYKVVVPYQKENWTYHDCGPSNLKNYDGERAKVIQTYPDVFDGSVNEDDANERQAILGQLAWIREAFYKLINAGAYNELCDAERQLREILGIRDKEVSEMINFASIYALEAEKDVKHSAIFEWRDWDKMYDYYKWTRLVIMRIGWDRADERIEILKDDIRNGIWSKEAILRIAQMCLDTGLEKVRCFLQEN
ncbi:MAG: glycosyltransferase family protein [Lachnospiraceae bacterium]|nr:glycosyltransferase family protein [Lachnospiraceae bacterium]